MKKFIFLPIVLAIFGVALVPGNGTINAKASEDTSLTLNLQEMAKGVDNLTSVDDVNAGLVSYGYRGGNPETATYTTFVHTEGSPNDGDLTTTNCVIDWGGARFVITSDYIIAYMTAHEDLTLTVGGSADGNYLNNTFKYFTTDSAFNFAAPTALTAVYSATPDVWYVDLAKTYHLYAGETFMFAYGISSKDGCNLQAISNITFTFNQLSAATETNNIEQIYSVPAWQGYDKAGTLANYGVRFGTNTETNPYAVSYTANGNGTYTVNDKVVEWWQIALTADTGFAFAVTATKRIMVTPTFANLNSDGSYGWLLNTSTHYDIYRNGTLLKNVYSYENTDNLSVDVANLNEVGAIELLARDVLYVGFTFNPGVTGERMLQLKSYDNFVVTTKEVLASKAVTNFINDWFALRNSNELDLCNLSAEDQAKLEALIDRYNALLASEREIVDRTIDVRGYTIADSISYFSVISSSANNMLNTILENSSYTTVITILIGCLATLLVSLLIYKKRTNK